MAFWSFFTKPDQTNINPEHHSKTIQKTLLELLFYVVFLIVASIISYGISGGTLYYMSDLLTKLFVDKRFAISDSVDMSFRDLNTIDEFWTYIEQIIIPTIYAAAESKEEEQPPPTEEEKEERVESGQALYIYDENLLLGPPRLRQLKVRNDSCDVHKLFKRNFLHCYSSYSADSNEYHHFSTLGSHNNETAFNYHSAHDLEGIFVWGLLHIYSGGGFYQDLSIDSDVTVDIFERLHNQSWIDRGTRVVFIEFAIYNANVNVFCSAKLIAEFPPSGGILTSYNFETVKLLRFLNSFDYFVLVCEVVFFLQVVWYTVVEACQLRQESWKYFKSFWNILDVTIVLISYTSVGYSIYRYLYTNEKIKSYTADPTKHVSVDVLAFWQSQYNAFMAICVFLIWIKVFKYLSFNKTMKQFSETLSRCAKDLLGFGLMFFIVFLAFAQLGYILFGTDNENFRTLGDSIFTLLRTVLGDFDYLAIERANRILGPIFFITYIFFVFFVLLNMFLAIINDTYSEVKSEDVSAEQIHIGRFLKKRLLNFWLKYSPKWILNISSKVNCCGGCKKKFQSEENAVQNEEQQDNRGGEMEARTYALHEIFEPIETDYVMKEISSLNRRITQIESSIDKILNKFDAFINEINVKKDE